MTVNEYLEYIIQKYIASKDSDVFIMAMLNPLLSEVRQWAGNCLQDIIISGSRAKGTAIKGSSDIDFLISLKSTTNNTLSEIYYSLYNHLKNKQYAIRMQNVSLGVDYRGYNIDLVPAKKHSGNTNFHSLYSKKRDSWMQTNIKQHIDFVINSGRTNEIKIIKIWAKLHNLDFPSIYLERSVINALEYRYKNKEYLGQNVITVFQYLEEQFETTKIIDISNSNNIISNDLTKDEKKSIAAEAKSSLDKRWEDIVW